jgi:hypothetical protein
MIGRVVSAEAGDQIALFFALGRRIGAAEVNVGNEQNHR